MTEDTKPDTAKAKREFMPSRIHHRKSRMMRVDATLYDIIREEAVRLDIPMTDVVSRHMGLPSPSDWKADIMEILYDE